MTVNRATDTGATNGTIHPLDPIFRPRATAIIGVSSKQTSMPSFLHALMEQGYHERHALYPVNPKMDEVAGLRCYPSLLACPDPVDHVISQIPARGVLDLVDECVKKGVRSLHLFTAGFSETGSADMADMEREIVRRLQAGGVRLIGPNCMGLYVPSSGLSFFSDFPRQTGPVMVISQSGGNAAEIVYSLAARGIRFSKVVSFGNGPDVDAAELLRYAAGDPETTIVTMYVEGVKDGRAFFDALAACAAVKPVLILKGGLSEVGARAAASHTGSLAGAAEIFDAVCRQTGAWRVESLDELSDLVVALSTGLGAVEGRRATFMTGGGGMAVLSADVLARYGIDLPELPDGVQAELREFIPEAGTGVRNPVDAAIGFQVGDQAGRALRLFAAEGVDVVVCNMGLPGPGFQVSVGVGSGDVREGMVHDTLHQMAAASRDTGIPFVGIRKEHDTDASAMAAFLGTAKDLGVAVFPSVERAARTVAGLREWRRRRSDLDLPAV